MFSAITAVSANAGSGNPMLVQTVLTMDNKAGWADISEEPSVVIATGDFNRDGIADLVITSEADNNYEVMPGNGNGTFTYAPELSHIRDPNSYCPS